MSLRELEALERLEALLEGGRAVRTSEDLEGLLESTARAIADVLEFDAIVINLRRPAWDDFEVVTVISPDPKAVETLRGSRNRLEDMAPLLDERFRRGRAYLARMPATEVSLGAVFVPDIPIAEDDDSWGATDWLLVPMRGAGGRLLGILSVDQPRSGKRPSSDELRLLASFTTVATLAVENAKRAAAAEEHRLALERLFEISSGLVQAVSVRELLDAVCRGVSDALGFGKVAVELADPQSGLLRAQAAAGWDLDDPKFGVQYRLADVEPLMDPAFELVGCYLLPSDAARERIASDLISYTSSNNGLGPEAWNHHWLVVPLRESTGRMIGVMWVDDPVDLLLPSIEKLQALRTFADQATIAIESHARMRSLALAGETRRALLKRIVQASEGERLRMAAGLHDGPVQGLAALMLRLETAMIALDHGRVDRAHDLVAAVQPTLGAEIAKLRTLMVELRPPLLDSMGVMAALTDHVARLELGGADVRVGQDLEPDVRPMDRERETVMYRIAQEAIANAVEHANAAHVDVSLGEDGKDVVLAVRDDGVGFDLEEAAASGRFGLAGMRERAEMVGGTLAIVSAPGAGTTVTFRIRPTVLGGMDATAEPEPSTLGA